MTIELKQNFARIIRTLLSDNLKLTHIAKSMGYTTTTQLHSALDGKSMLSTKAIMGLIEQFNINPIYLFLGNGEMFLTDESEIEKLRGENQKLMQNHDAALKTVVELERMIKTLEKRNADLIDLTGAAIKYHKSKDTEEDEI